jgi:hypothetical protein
MRESNGTGIQPKSNSWSTRRQGSASANGCAGGWKPTRTEQGLTATNIAVSTLYLDTAARDVFHRRGSYGRSKLRVRRYGEERGFFSSGNSGPGRDSPSVASTFSWTALPLLKALTPATTAPPGSPARQPPSLEPVCRVSYLRTARAAVTEDGRMRMTLDYSLSASTADAFSLDGRGPAVLLPGQMILELKYRGGNASRVPRACRRVRHHAGRGVEVPRRG